MDQPVLPLAAGAEQLSQMLSSAGVDPSTMDLSTCWPIYKLFASMPLDAMEELITFSWGAYNFFLNRATFQIRMARQATTEDGEGNTSSQQIDCRFFYDLTKELQQEEGSIASYSYDSLDGFLLAVEQSTGFAAAQGPPIHRHIDQWSL